MVALNNPHTQWTPSNWMQPIDGETLLSELSIPGTHDSGALHGSDKRDEWRDEAKNAIGKVNTGFSPLDTIGNFFADGIREVAGAGANVVGSVVDTGTGVAAKCQALSIKDQLEAGTRFLDIRVRNHGNHFLIFHGAVYQHQGFGDVYRACIDFLDANPSECILMSLKRDHDDENPTLPLEARFDAYVSEHPDRWYLGDSIPALGAVRGKIVLMRRFAAERTPKGIDLTGIRDNATSDLNNPNAHVMVQDCYDLDSTEVSTKWAEIEEWLKKAAADSDERVLYLNFSSAVGGAGLPVPALMASAINPRLASYLNEHTLRKTGILVMDFMVPTLNEMIIRMNFRA